MTRTMTVESPITGVNTRTALLAQGSVTTPSRVVPKGASKIVKIVATVAQDGAAAGSGVFFMRLSGPGILQGEQVLMVAGAGIIAVQSGGDGAAPYTAPLVIDNVDIAVSETDTINIDGEMAGEDMGTASMVVTLIFA